MIKIDLHIHTDPADYEPAFNFSLDKLKEYINKNHLDVIAITNHNHFNRKQFETITNSTNIDVLPGVEVDIEKAHLLVITKKEDIDELELSCSELIQYISSKDKKISITFDEFITIFKNWKNYLLIPHYKKKPIMQATTIRKFTDNIYCGEVRSAKQFEVIKKAHDSLAPVLFSDIRIDEDLDTFPVRNTYIDISNFEFSKLTTALKDRNKIYISDDKNENEFEFLPDGTTASTQLNVIVGKRSSGKTYNLNQIYNSNDSDVVKYIKQFSLTGNSEESKFKELLEQDQDFLIENYLTPLKQLTENMLHIKEDYINNIDDYLSSLKEFAANQSLKDAYSKTKIFNQPLFNSTTKYDTYDLIKSALLFLESSHNRELIDKYIEKENLLKLLGELICRYEKEQLDKNLKDYADEILKITKGKLSSKSSLKAVKDVDMYLSLKNKLMIEEYNTIVNKLKFEKLISSTDVYGFKIELTRRAYKNATELRKVLKYSPSLKDEFKMYPNPYRFITSLSKIVIPSVVYKSLLNFDINVKNSYGHNLSGGERAEYNLLHELKDSDKYDILLLDEPEASFDNPFIKSYIIDILKDISMKTTVFLSTHNNTLGMLLKPNKIIYTEVNNNDYKVYTGDFGAKELSTVDGDKIQSFTKLMDVMEAGTDAYKERKKIYEDFEN